MFTFQHESADLYESISIKKFNNLKVERLKSNLKCTELKVVKKDNGKRKKC